MNRKLHILALVILLAPAAYLAIIWKQLPAIVPMHYNIKGEVDRFGNKSEMIGVLLMISAVNLLVYLVLTNLHRIDPKKKNTVQNLPRMQRMALVITAFPSGMCGYIVYTTQHSHMKFGAS